MKYVNLSRATLLLYNLRFVNLLSRSNRNRLFSVAVVNSFLCLLVIDGDSLETISTRPLSCVAREDLPSSNITTIGLSPDSNVIFLVDEGLSCIIRMEVDSGHCRSFGHDFCCKYLKVNTKNGKDGIIFKANAVGLTFTNDSILLHHCYKTMEMTSMGITITKQDREIYCVRAASTQKYLVTAG